MYISDRAYTKDQVLGMEKIMLNTLKFNLTVPTPHNFLTRFLKVSLVFGLSPEHSAGIPCEAELCRATLYRFAMSPVSARVSRATTVASHSKDDEHCSSLMRSTATVHQCLIAFSQAAGLAGDAVAGNYAAYLVELALPDYGMLKYSYSMVAAAAVQLTNRCAPRTVSLQLPSHVCRPPERQTLLFQQKWFFLVRSACISRSASDHLC